MLGHLLFKIHRDDDAGAHHPDSHRPFQLLVGGDCGHNLEVLRVAESIYHLPAERAMVQVDHAQGNVGQDAGDVYRPEERGIENGYQKNHQHQDPVLQDVHHFVNGNAPDLPHQPALLTLKLLREKTTAATL